VAIGVIEVPVLQLLYRSHKTPMHSETSRANTRYGRLKAIGIEKSAIRYSRLSSTLVPLSSMRDPGNCPFFPRICFFDDLCGFHTFKNNLFFSRSSRIE
jgi:hypothetical protein